MLIRIKEHACLRDFYTYPNYLEIGARRDLTEDLNKVQRTSGWVANLERYVEGGSETRSLNLNTASSSSSNLSTQKVTSTTVTTTTSYQQKTMHYQRQSSYGFQTPDKSRHSSPGSAISGGSPRLQAFEGEAWKRSPRTGMLCYRKYLGIISVISILIAFSTSRVHLR